MDDFKPDATLAYMAVQFKGISGSDTNSERGWIKPALGVTTAGVEIGTGTDDDEKDAKGPPDATYFSAVRGLKAKITRPYGGIGSSGGPQTSQRTDHTNFVLERSVDNISPYFMEYCCNGKQIAWLHFQFVDQGQVTLHIRLKDVFIADYEYNGTRFFGTYVDSQGIRGSALTGVGHSERIELIYTGIHFRRRHYDAAGTLVRSGSGGWDTGIERAFS